MTIDLEQFVGKECIITLNDDRTFETIIEKSNRFKSYPYSCIDNNNNNFSLTFTREGIYSNEYPNGEMTIQSIRLKTPTQPINPPELPGTMIEKLAEVLSSDAVKYIAESEQYVTFMAEMLTMFVRERVGNLKPEVEAELVTIMGVNKIDLREVK